MDFKLTSTALYTGEAIDGRCLILAAEFYQISKQEALEMADDITGWIKDLLQGGFVSKTFIGGKPVGKGRPLCGLSDSLSSNLGWSFGIEGMVNSPVVHNIKTFNQYFRNIRQGSYKAAQITPGVSIDYGNYWDSIFPEATDSMREKQNYLRIFQEKGKHLISAYTLPDVQASLFFTPYQKIPNFFYGSFAIRISSFCLGNAVIDMAETFELFAKQLSEKYIKLNARVMLQPPTLYPSPYMHYFGTDGKTDGSHIKYSCTEHEWYSRYYIPGAEWCNILSPLARKHLPDVHYSEAVQTHELSGGGLMVKSNRPILQYDVPDAMEVKRFLYPALYPGRSAIPLSVFRNKIQKESMSNFPRSNWAVVPMFENEIEIVSTYLVFSKAPEDTMA